MNTTSGLQRLARLETPAFESGHSPTLTEALERARSAGRSGTHGLRFVDLRERETVVSWAEVVARAEVTAQRFCAVGLQQGDRVALVFSTGPEFFDGFFGALLAGGVPVPLYPPVRLGKMQQYDERTTAMLDAAQARLVLVEARVDRLLGGVKRGYDAPLGFLTPANLQERAEISDESWSCPKVTPSDLALVQFSSGTTVAPKPVALSHAALLHQAAILAGHWPDTEEVEQAGVSWLPLYHDMGLIGCVLPALLRVANLWLLPPEVFLARPALWLRTLSRTRATISPAPNFAYSLCAERVRDRDLDNVDLSHWRAALNGAEAVSQETVRAFTQRFRKQGFDARAMTPVYGLAEAALAVTFSDLEAAPTMVRFSRDALAEGRAVPADIDEADDDRTATGLVSVGKPVPGFAVEVRSSEGTVVSEGCEGEVFIRGRSMLSGYLEAGGALLSVLNDGWLGTGDLGFVHQGELYLTGRKKDVLVLRGRNWSAVPIEEVVSMVEGIRTGCAVAVSALMNDSIGEDGGRRPQPPSSGQSEQLWVIAETRAAPDQHERITKKVRQEVLVCTGLRVARLDLVEPGELPRTSSGKLRRAAAKALAEAGKLRPAGGAGLVERIKRRPSVEAALALLHSRREQR